jgi:hypothetical protein
VSYDAAVLCHIRFLSMSVLFIPKLKAELAELKGEFLPWNETHPHLSLARHEGDLYDGSVVTLGFRSRT